MEMLEILYLIIKTPTDISTIYGRHKREVLPVFPLKVFVVQVARCAVPASGHKDGCSLVGKTNR